MTDHDRLFKELLTTFFVEFLELFLPDVHAYLDESSVDFLDKELFTDVTSGERHEADLVVKAKFRNQHSFFLVHIENQAQPQTEFGARMFRYFARLHEKHTLPVYPIAVFSHEPPRASQPDVYRVAFPDLVVLDFHYQAIQLKRLYWRDFVRRENPVASALMAKMQIAPEDRPFVKAECLRLMSTLQLDPAKMQLIIGFVDTYLRLTAEEEEIFRRELAKIVPEAQEQIVDIMTSWEERGVQQGLQQGLEQGLQQGLQQGKRQATLTLVLRLLTRRLDAVEPVVRERIESLSLVQLEQLGEGLLDFSTSADLVAWLDKSAA